MPRRRKTSVPDEAIAPVPEALLEQFARAGPLTAEEVEAAMRRFKKALIERALGGELTHHLGYAPGAEKPDATTKLSGLLYCPGIASQPSSTPSPEASPTCRIFLAQPGGA